MGKLFHYLKMYKGWIALILCILIVQAYSDLSLPNYTSDIVNVGIQQNGIATRVPMESLEIDFENLLLVAPENKQEEVRDAYELVDGKYQLKQAVSKDEEALEELANVMKMPMLVALALDSDTEESKGVQEQLAAHLGVERKDVEIFEMLASLPVTQRSEVLKGIEEQLETMPDMLLEQMTVAYIKQAYERAGKDMTAMQNRYILLTGAKMLGFALLGTCASVLVGLIGSKVAGKVGHNLRGRVFKKVVGFSSSEFDDFSTASLITRTTNDIQQIQTVLVFILRMIFYAPILALGGVYKVFQTNSSMFWIIGLAILVIACVVCFLFLMVMPRFKAVQTKVDRLNLVTREVLTGLEVIRAFGQERHEEQRFDVANKDLMKTQLFVNRAMAFMMPIIMLVMNVVTVVIVWAGANSIDTGVMQVGDMMAFITYAMQIIMAFLMICMVSIFLPRAAISAERVDEVLKSETLIKDAKKPDRLAKNGSGQITFENVSFCYPNAEENVLSNINFTAKAGETTAFIGSTGSGKSTLINLVPRFFDVTKGRILLDGQDIRDITQHDLRSKLGYVPQKGVLFSGTIASNIAYADNAMCEEDIELAASIAQATEFIKEKEQGYDSPISQGGSNVSGGQKQRLSIARAIAKKPKVFIFDDSFSALDYKTDVALRAALKEHTSDSTVLIVAQRISTIMQAEQIIVLDEGEIAGSGTHSELLKTCEAYQQIASSQMSEEEMQREMQGGEQS